MTHFLRRTGLAAVLVLIGALGLSACGSSSTGGGASSSSSSGGSGVSQQALQAAYKGVTGTPPTTATKTKAGVNAWVISCGQQVPSCATPTAAIQQAAQSAGWTVKVCDGQLNPDGWGSCMRQAVSAKATVVFPVGIDCASIQQPFSEAKSAGVQIVGAGGSDCSETGGQSLMASERIDLADYPTVKQNFELEGKLAADWIIGKTGGNAQVLEAVFTDPVWGPWLSAGFEKELATCSGCKVVNKLQLANNDFVSGSANQKFSTALLQAASANSVFVPVGGWMVTGFAQAVQSSGRSAQLNVISGFGDKSNMDLIRNNSGQDAVVGYPTPWGGWGSVDTAVRVLNGEKPLPEGDGMQVVDKDHNLPSAGQDYTGGVDYTSAYKKAWGLSS